MILKALYDFYHRHGNLPQPGTELKQIEFVVVIDRDGRFKRFESKRIDKSKCASFIVPKGEARTSSPKPNNLWDNGKYVLGFEEKDKEHHSLFVDRVRQIASANPQDASIMALKAFYDTPGDTIRESMASDPLFEDVQNRYSSNFSFQLEGEDRLIAEKIELVRSLSTDEDSIEGICLVTGERSGLVRITSPTPIIGNVSTASLVGMQKNSGYDSYGKEQAYNSPISKEAEFAYTSALRYMISKDSRHSFRIGTTTFLFWGSGKSEVVQDVEDSFYNLYGLELDKGNSLDENLGKVEKLFASIWSGEIRTTLDDRFYILGLVPNTGRIAVVLWNDMTLKDFAGELIKHFRDMEIADNRRADNRRPYSALYGMLSAVTLNRKAGEAPAPLVRDVMNAMITGRRYPYALYTMALDRIRAELHKGPMWIGLAAILKAYINRATEYNNNIKPLTPMLDNSNDNAGYVCGRLAAVMEKMQSDANGSDTIRTTFLTAASATPATVFPNMLSLSNHHLDKLTPGARIYYEKLKQEIISLLSASGFPARLDIIDQGRFFVGYYHQKCDLYSKKD